MSAEPRTARGRATRERILDVTTSLIGERGIAGTSLEDVRHAAGVSKSQLYLYFRDRDDLLRAVAHTTCDRVMDAQADVLAEFDSVAGVARYLAGTVALQEQRKARGGCPIGTLAGQLAETDEPARLELVAGMDRWQAGLRAGLEAMRSRGELRADADPGVLAGQVLALIQGGLLLTQIRRDTAAIRDAADGALQLIRASLDDKSL
ncbi:MAG: TetR/AcrR family transcriptional regulator [Solirubrobacterales bacterium]|nr:TetR/AcrR family transcriptional regulator [Solirubrobacterales bacterium]